MTEQEAWLLIRRFNEELTALNDEDSWEVVILQVPQEERDEQGNPTDEWHVEVGWHCWCRHANVPMEYGLHLAVSNPDTTPEFVYGLLDRNCSHTMGTVTTFRTFEEAKLGLFN